MSIDYTFRDFTEGEYRSLLRIAKARWRFIPYSDYRTPDSFVCLWRHDIDFSPHRALKLAQIEAEEEVVSTYFVLLHSNFYNALEDDIVGLIKAIARLGHHIGLHFDPSFYRGKKTTIGRWLRFERKILSDVFEADVLAISLHNPTLNDSPSLFLGDSLGGMVNAYGSYIKKHFSYCSDSNGFWRFKPLRHVLEDVTQQQRLQVLTHGVWWTPEPMSPRDRVTRCIDGRAGNIHKEYNLFLAEHGRDNIGGDIPSEPKS